jgi:hypothetical protein
MFLLTNSMSVTVSTFYLTRKSRCDLISMFRKLFFLISRVFSRFFHEPNPQRILNIDDRQGI